MEEHRETIKQSGYAIERLRKLAIMRANIDWEEEQLRKQELEEME